MIKKLSCCYLFLILISSCTSSIENNTAKLSPFQKEEIWNGIGSIKVKPIDPATLFSSWDSTDANSQLYCLMVKVDRTKIQKGNFDKYNPQKICLLIENDTISPFDVISEPVFNTSEDRFTLSYEVPRKSIIETLIYADSLYQLSINNKSF
jgi:hypothetical protein